MDLVETKMLKYKHSNRHPWELARVRVVKFLINRNFKELLLNGNSKIIDIGCGDIFLLNKISQLFGNGKFYGIDTAFTSEYISQLDKFYNTFDVTLFQSTEQIKVDEADLILMLDVIEHIADDKYFFKNLLSKEWITSETNFLITVPAFQFLFCKHDNFLGHYRRYSNKSLKTSLKEAGLTVVNTGYFFNLLLYPRFVSKIFEILKPNNREQKGIGEWKGSKIITNILIQFLYFDFLFCYYLSKIGIKLPGLSNYAICKKSV
jgi:SAM-dependent methyltransferase